MIGETMDDAGDVAGAVVVRKKDSYRFQLWTKTAKDKVGSGGGGGGGGGKGRSSMTSGEDDEEVEVVVVVVVVVTKCWVWYHPFLPPSKKTTTLLLLLLLHGESHDIHMPVSPLYTFGFLFCFFYVFFYFFNVEGTASGHWEEAEGGDRIAGECGVGVCV